MLQIILFGDSLTALAFEAESRGFGRFLSQPYEENAAIRNEARKVVDLSLNKLSSPTCYTMH